MNSTPRPIPNVTITGISRHVSTNARATFSRSGGSKVRDASDSVAALRNRTGGLPSHDDPDLALLGAADSTATSPFLGTRRPGPAMPELPRNARLPTLAGSMRIQPPPSS